MCLSNVTKTYKRPSKVAREAFKVFEKFHGRLRQIFYPISGEEDPEAPREVPLGKWLKARKTEIGTWYSGQKYLSGFHVFPTFASAEDYAKNDDARVVVTVKIRGVRTLGIKEYGGLLLATIVADEMFVPKPRIQKTDKKRKPAKKGKK